MNLENLKRANEIIKELDKLEDRIDEYDQIIKEIKEDIERGETEEHIYHANNNFTCSTKQYLHFIEGIKHAALEDQKALNKEFKNI